MTTKIMHLNILFVCTSFCCNGIFIGCTVFDSCRIFRESEDMPNLNWRVLISGGFAL